jgi:predicted lysophospholipase L1 biosynthesis ABC-type transport system permease subunit
MEKEDNTLNEINERLKRIEKHLQISDWLVVTIFGFAVVFSFMQLFDMHKDIVYYLLSIGAFVGALFSLIKLRQFSKQNN